MKYHFADVDAVLKEKQSSLEGLSRFKATKRLRQNGPNILREQKRPNLLRRFFTQINDPMVIVLLVAAAFSVAFGGLADMLIIMVVVVLNAVLGLFQEGKAERAIDRLTHLTAPTAIVRREGKVKKIKASEVVEGDIVLVEAGDIAPADLRIIEAINLKSDESSLTGESHPIEKIATAIKRSGHDIALGDRKNMLFMGCSIVYGRGEGVAVACGMRTQMGKIASMLNQTKQEKTPLQKRLAELSRILSIAVLIIAAFIFIFSIVTSKEVTLASVLDTFMLAVSLAVAAIPEGIVVVVTLVLSIGVSKMSRQEAIIRKIPAVETLGCTEIICADKTGTLTQNTMKVVDATGNLQRMGLVFALCNDVRLSSDAELFGDPTEVALVEFAKSQNLDVEKLSLQMPRVAELPFDSDRKMMTTVHVGQGGNFWQFCKGAPDRLICQCNCYYNENGKVVPLTQVELERILNKNNDMACQALRVLAAAERCHNDLPSAAEYEKDLVFIGLVGMSDPPRPEAAPAVAAAAAAGIKTVMISGDHIDTALTIACELGIAHDRSQAIEGHLLDGMGDEELQSNIERYRVYARVQPEHKMRIVTAWRKKGRVTAMTGDGVNDAPALKVADIGIGMGINGSEVSKSVSDMVLANDNFATIIAAIREGRRVYDNITKAIQFLLSSNLAEVLIIFVATLLGFKLFLPVHLLWINLITDCFPAIALGYEMAEADLMRRKPRRANQSIFADGMGIAIFWQGTVVAILTLAAFLYGLRYGYGVATTMAFVTLSLTEIFHSLNMRSRHRSIFKLGRRNIYLVFSTLISLALSLILLYVPILNSLFSLTPLSINELVISLVLALMIIPIVETVKLLCRTLRRFS